MTELMQAHREWANRPMDERYLNLIDMLDFMRTEKMISRHDVRPVKSILERLTPGPKGQLAYTNPRNKQLAITNWFFGQLCSRLEAPAGYLRTLTPELVIGCLKDSKAADEQAMIYGSLDKMKAITSPSYGRIYNYDVVQKLVQLVGDGTGRDTDWRVPGIRKIEVPITHENTTLYASDRDMFVFLADERNPIEIPNVRDSSVPRTLARGFFISNSEVGAGTFRISTFLFDEVCENRIVWGAESVRLFKIKHTSRAPLRVIEEAMPYLDQIVQQSPTIEQDRIKMAMNDKCAAKFGSATGSIPSKQSQYDDAFDWLGKRMPSQKAAREAITIHEREEGFVPRTRYDMINAATAYAKTIPYQDERVKVEALAGSWL